MVQICFSLFQWDCAGRSQAPEHHGKLAALLPVCLEADLFPAGLESAKGITCSPPAFALSWPAVTWWAWGGTRAGAQPPTRPRQTVLRHPFPPPGAAPANSPTNPLPQCPHPPVAPDWCAVTTRLCLIHGWGLGRVSQERKELPWGLAQFLPAHRAHGRSLPGPGAGRRSCPWAWRTLFQHGHSHYSLICSPGMSAGQSAGSPRAPRGLR